MRLNRAHATLLISMQPKSCCLPSPACQKPSMNEDKPAHTTTTTKESMRRRRYRLAFLDFLPSFLSSFFLLLLVPVFKNRAVKFSMSSSSEAACAKTRDHVGSRLGPDKRGSWCDEEEADSWPREPGEVHIRRRLLPVLMDTKQP